MNPSGGGGDLTSASGDSSPGAPTHGPGPNCPQKGGPPSWRPQFPSQYTAEEARVLRECKRDSFYQRSLPIGSALAAGAWYMVRVGRWKPNSRFGAAPKMVAAGIVGYFIGKMSYVGVCRDRILALENSPMAETLKHWQRQKMDWKGGQQEVVGVQLDPQQPPAEQPARPAGPAGPVVNKYGDVWEK